MQTLSIFAAACLLLVEPITLATEERVDVIEHNRFYNPDNAKHVFDQVIFRDHHRSCVDRIVDWRLVKNKSHVPYRDFARGEYVMRWWDNDKFRVVRSGVLTDTWTNYDPELEDREVFPRERRRGLR